MTALPPKLPRNLDPLWFSQPPVVDDEARIKQIEIAAYLRAQRRAFAAGYEVEDWLAAEVEVDCRYHIRR